MKFFEPAIKALPRGFEVFLSLRRIKRIVIENLGTAAAEISDEELIEIFIDLSKKYECTAYPYTENNEKGMVIRKD